MQKIVSAAQAHKQFFQLLKFAGKHGNHVTILKEGQPPVLMLSKDEFEGWVETMEIMSDPQLMKDIQEGIEDKETIPWSEVKKMHSINSKKRV